MLCWRQQASWGDSGGIQQGKKDLWFAEPTLAWWVEGRDLETVLQGGVPGEEGKASREETQVRKQTGKRVCSCREPGRLEEKAVLWVWGEG